MRETGGLGDILMHRMMFEDFKRTLPGVHLTFACPPQYFPAVDDHPFIDEIVDNRTVQLEKYVISYNTTSACTRHEIAVAPLAYKNRSDIWANHCGVELTNHEMHIQLTPDQIERGKELLGNYKRPIVIFCPISAMITKNLLKFQMDTIVEELKRRRLSVIGLHKSAIPELNIPVIYGIKIKEWMGILNAADYVVSVDSAALHFAGGIKKPVVGIFTFADGFVYTKYYSTVTIVQLHRDTHPEWTCGPCYNWGMCPLTTKIPKPCLTKITSEMLIDGLDRMFQKYPF